MIYIQASQTTFLQKVIFFIILAAFLVGAFFVTMALLPLIVVIIVYLWFKYRNMAKQMRQAQEDMFNRAESGDYSQFQTNYLHTEQYQDTKASQGQEDVYDIAPEDYTIEDKNN